MADNLTPEDAAERMEAFIIYGSDVAIAGLTAILAAKTRCRERIAYLRSLPEGWHDGFGHPPTPESAATALRLLSRNPGMAASYSIFPTDAGGLLFEFVHSGWNYSIEIEPGGTAEMHGTEIEGDAGRYSGRH